MTAAAIEAAIRAMRPVVNVSVTVSAMDDPEAEPNVKNDPVPIHPDDPQPTEDDPGGLAGPWPDDEQEDTGAEA